MQDIMNFTCFGFFATSLKLPTNRFIGITLGNIEIYFCPFNNFKDICG